MLDFLLTIMKFSISSFGGGGVILALMQKEFVDTNIVSVQDFMLAVGLSQITPGPAAPGAVAFVGYRMFGILGILISCIGLFIPSFILSYLLFKTIEKFRTSKLLDSIFLFLKPITVALITVVTIFLARITIINQANQLSINIGALVIGLIALIGLGKYKLNTFYIVFVCGVLGIFVF